MKIRELYLFNMIMDMWIEHNTRNGGLFTKPPDLVSIMNLLTVHQNCCNDIMDKHFEDFRYKLTSERTYLR